MSVDRRTLLLGLGAAAALGTSARRSASAPAATKGAGASHDVVVVGAGCFGSWIAWHLRRAGRTVLLLDAYGPANARASSGGEARVTRTSYGAGGGHTRLSVRS